jgi:hypothetical protein
VGVYLLNDFHPFAELYMCQLLAISGLGLLASIREATSNHILGRSNPDKHLRVCGPNFGCPRSGGGHFIRCMIG